MLAFDPADPFPLVDEERHSRREEQIHSESVDAWLGLEVPAIEAKLIDQGCRRRAPGPASGEKQQLWIGLDSRDLLTPYTEIRRWLARVSPRSGATVVDLGAGYGRMGHVLGRHHPGTRFIGYEYVGERVEAGRRALIKGGCQRAKLEHVDLAAATFVPALADVYFIYDYGTSKAIEKTLHDMRRIAQARAITVIARGRRCREAIEQRHHWLRKLDPFESEGRATIYTSLEERSIAGEERHAAV